MYPFCSNRQSKRICWKGTFLNHIDWPYCWFINSISDRCLDATPTPQVSQAGKRLPYLRRYFIRQTMAWWDVTAKISKFIQFAWKSKNRLRTNPVLQHSVLCMCETHSKSISIPSFGRLTNKRNLSGSSIRWYISSPKYSKSGNLLPEVISWLIFTQEDKSISTTLLIAKLKKVKGGNSENTTSRGKLGIKIVESLQFKASADTADSGPVHHRIPSPSTGRLSSMHRCTQAASMKWQIHRKVKSKDTSRVVY